jgi:hypothetical protein
MDAAPYTPSANGDAVAPEVHQAAGMVVVQLDVDIAEAEARLRAYAIAVHRPLRDVARDIVAHRLRLDEPTG